MLNQRSSYMKRLLLCAAFMMMFFGMRLQGCQAECRSSCNGILSTIKSELGKFGDKVDRIELPLIGPLGTILPIAVITFCLKKFPGQVMLLSGLAVAYNVYQNETMKTLTNYCKNSGLFAKKNKKQKRVELLNDAFFVFHDEDLLEESDIEEQEDELLDFSMLQDDEMQHKKRGKTRETSKLVF